MLGWALPIRAGHRAGDRVAGGLVGERGRAATEQVDLDELPLAGALAMAQGGEDPDRGEQAGEHVDERDADLLRLAVGLAGDAHQAADGLDEQVVAGELRAGARRRSP